MSTSCTRITTECNRVSPTGSTPDSQPPDRPNAAWPARVCLLSQVMTQPITAAMARRETPSAPTRGLHSRTGR